MGSISNAFAIQFNVSASRKILDEDQLRLHCDGALLMGRSILIPSQMRKNKLALPDVTDFFIKERWVLAEAHIWRDSGCEG